MLVGPMPDSGLASDVEPQYVCAVTLETDAPDELRARMRDAIEGIALIMAREAPERSEAS